MCHAKLLQSCPTRDSIDCSPPGFPVHGILQARMLKWVAIPTSRGSSGPGIKPWFLTSSKLAGKFFTTSATWESYIPCIVLNLLYVGIVSFYPIPKSCKGRYYFSLSLSFFLQFQFYGWREFFFLMIFIEVKVTI